VSLEDELRRIDHEIRKLKIEFDLYFVGANPKPPTDHRDAVDKTLKKYQNTPMKNVGDRFLFNSIVNKFNAYQELWTKSLRVKEEGARLHPLAVHKAHLAGATETGGTNGPPASVAVKRGGRPRAAGSDSWRVPLDRQDERAVRRLYESFIAAKARVGDAKQPSYEAFSREIARHTASLRGKSDCGAIDFKIYCSDNKVSLKAKPAK
jgi:hypothetical protein